MAHSPAHSMDERLAFLRAHGSDPIACSTLQEGLSYLDTSFGYVAYRKALGFAVTLGPPVCAPSDSPELIDRFARAFRRPLFLYLPRDAAERAAATTGGHWSGMGVERVLSLSGPDATDRRVRSALRKATAAGFALREVDPGALGPEERRRFEEITRDFVRRSAAPNEMRFVNRPLAFEGPIPGRMLALHLGDRVFGYAVLDPYFRQGSVRGYLLNLVRFERTRLWGVYWAVVDGVVRMLRSEGGGEGGGATPALSLSLGYLPLTSPDTQSGTRVLSAQVRWAAERLGQVSYAARLRELKEALPGTSVDRYFVTPSPILALSLLAVVAACGVPLGWLIGPQLFRAIAGGRASDQP